MSGRDPGTGRALSSALPLPQQRQSLPGLRNSFQPIAAASCQQVECLGRQRLPVTSHAEAEAAGCQPLGREDVRFAVSGAAGCFSFLRGAHDPKAAEGGGGREVLWRTVS